MKRATIDSNLDTIDAKIKELGDLRQLIKKQIDSMEGNYRMKMAFTELLKNLLDVDKTILAYIKESNAVLYKQERDSKQGLAGPDGKKKNALLHLMTRVAAEVEDEIEDVKDSAGIL